MPDETIAAPVNSRAAIRRAWDRRVGEYSQMLTDPARRGLAAAIEAAAFARALPGASPLDLLDLGCGPGYHGHRLLAAGHRVVFCDISPAMLCAVAVQGRPTSSCVEADARDLAVFGDGAFDGVVAGGTVISDCGGPEQALAEVARILRPGGVAGLSLRHLLGPQQRPPATACLAGAGDGFDWWFYSRHSATRLCEAAGLVAEATYPVLAAPPTSLPADAYVSAHLDQAWDDRQLTSAYELFIIARKPTTAR